MVPKVFVPKVLLPKVLVPKVLVPKGLAPKGLLPKILLPNALFPKVLTFFVSNPVPSVFKLSSFFTGKFCPNPNGFEFIPKGLDPNFNGPPNPVEPKGFAPKGLTFKSVLPKVFPPNPPIFKGSVPKPFCPKVLAPPNPIWPVVFNPRPPNPGWLVVSNGFCPKGLAFNPVIPRGFIPKFWLPKEFVPNPVLPSWLISGCFCPNVILPNPGVPRVPGAPKPPNWGLGGVVPKPGWANWFGCVAPNVAWFCWAKNAL